MTLTPRQEIEQKAQRVADGMGITVWITEDGRIVQSTPKRGGIEIRPNDHAKPTPHGAPTKYEAPGGGE